MTPDVVQTLALVVNQRRDAERPRQGALAGFLAEVLRDGPCVSMSDAL